MGYVLLRPDAGTQLQRARLAKNISRNALYRRSNVSVRTIERLEGGAPRAQEDSVCQLCAHLDLPLQHVVAESVLNQRLWRPLVARVRAEQQSPDHRPIIFVAAPMTAAGADYSLMRGELQEVVTGLRASVPGHNVFCAFEEIESAERFEDEALALAGNIARLRAASVLVAIYPKQEVTSVLVEIGIALGIGLPTMVLVRDRSHLPWLLRGHSAGDPPFKVIRYRDWQDVLSLLTSEATWLASATPRV